MPGESLVYAVRWGVLTVGEAVSETLPAETFVPLWETLGKQEPEYGFITLQQEGSPAPRPALSWPRMACRVRATARSRAWVPYKVHNEIESWIDAEGTFPWRFYKSQREGGSLKEEHVEIDHRDGTAYYYKKRAEESEAHLRRVVRTIEPLAQDCISVLYFLRLSSLELGSVRNIRVHTDGQSWDTMIHVVREERLETPAGTFDCLVVKPIFRYEGLFSRESDPTVWIEKRTHIVVQMEVKVTIGHIRTYLTEASGVPSWEGR